MQKRRSHVVFRVSQSYAFRMSVSHFTFRIPHFTNTHTVDPIMLSVGLQALLFVFNLILSLTNWLVDLCHQQYTQWTI